MQNLTLQYIIEEFDTDKAENRFLEYMQLLHDETIAKARLYVEEMSNQMLNENDEESDENMSQADEEFQLKAIENYNKIVVVEKDLRFKKQQAVRKICRIFYHIFNGIYNLKSSGNNSITNCIMAMAKQSKAIHLSKDLCTFFIQIHQHIEKLPSEDLKVFMLMLGKNRESLKFAKPLSRMRDEVSSKTVSEMELDLNKMNLRSMGRKDYSNMESSLKNAKHLIMKIRLKN
jgi:hypothetical protein